MTGSHLYSFRFYAGVLLALITLSEVIKAQSLEQVIAVVNDKAITQAEVDNLVFSELFGLQQQIYALRKAALENLISRKVLEGEARRRSVSVEELRRQLTTGPVDIATSRVDEVYAENAAVFGNMSPDEVRERLRLDLESQARMQKYREALMNLKKDSRIQSFLEEPRLPTVTYQNAPWTGNEKAPVTIVEFSDFQCPFCRNSQAALRDVLNYYPQQVKLIFKHRPLEIHSEAFASAQAAFCAGQQHAFWQYHDALFASQDLSAKALQKIAANQHLDLTRFGACLASTDSRDAVQADVAEAQKFGINSTPTFVINGRVVRGALNFDEFKAAIEKELRSFPRGNP